jgi:hypothetical protein
MSSSALSSAKNRRASNNTNDNMMRNNNNNNNNSQIPRTPMNINTFFQAMNTRISKLEQNYLNNNNNQSQNINNTIDSEEINTRFDIIVNEIADIKDMLLKLQTFTMEVNKALYDDRINVLSNIDNNSLDINNSEDLDKNMFISDISGN